MRHRAPAAAVVLALTASIALTGCSSEAAVAEPAGAVELTETLQASDTVVLDVRTPEEFAAGHVEGARNIDVNAPDFGQQIAALPTDVPYVVYCRSGNRSQQAVALMEQAGFTEVANVEDGLATLAEAGIPLVQ